MFGIRHGLTLIRRYEDSLEFYNFGTAQQELSVLDKLINNQEALEKFIPYFHEKAGKLIEGASRQAFDLTGFDYNPKKLHKYRKNRVYIGSHFNHEYLTRSEIDCLKSLIQGSSLPDIAYQSHKSVRTIEKHIENIKRKLNCSSQCQLGYLVAKYSLDKHWEE